MDGMLSQEEINALFSNMDDGPTLDEPEIKADEMGFAGDSSIVLEGDTLTDIEKDALGEVSNISMGTAATTLNALVNQPVNITTPMVSYGLWSKLSDEFTERPCVALQLGYKEGLDGNNILVLKEYDVLVITDLMMGGDGTNVSGEVGELHLSAICEAMNQMMGSSSTSLASMLGKKIDILPPLAKIITFQDNTIEVDPKFRMEEFIKVSFKLTIGALVDSEIMQLYPITFAKKIYEMFMGGADGGSPPDLTPEIPIVPKQEQSIPTPPPMQQPSMDYGNSMNAGYPPQMGMPPTGAMPDPAMMNNGQMNGQQMPPYGGYPGGGYPNMPYGGYPPMYYPPQNQMYQQQAPYGGAMPDPSSVNVQNAQFQSFSAGISPIQQKENIDLIMDVPLEVTVELGKTKKSIKDILEFSPGTIIELNKIAGEPIDVMVNGKYVAKGEVVVIEESFAVRVTEIIKEARNNYSDKL